MPDDTPNQPWWYVELKKWAGWRVILPWLANVVLLLLYWLVSGKKPDFPLPPVFEITLNESELTEDQVEELERRQIKVRRTGWRQPSEEETAATLRILAEPRFADTPAGKAVMGDDDAPLWRLAIKGRGGRIPDRDQGQIGSCVGHGSATGVEYTMAAQVAIAKVRQSLPDISSEAIYAGSRVEVNGGRVPFNGDGSTGAWAAKWLETTGGALARGVYGNHDLTTYNVQRCKQWGTKGVPDELEPEARKHKAKCSLVTSASDAKKALAQGYAINVCSGQGFASVRDADGFAKAQGSWAHSMCIIGYRADKPGFLIENSWGSSWISGPKGKFDDIPDGSFWATESVVDRMLKQGDSYAIANADGFQKRKIDPSDWIVQIGGPARDGKQVIRTVRMDTREVETELANDHYAQPIRRERKGFDVFALAP